MSESETEEKCAAVAAAPQPRPRPRLQPVWPERLDITNDRGDAFYLSKERWDDYVLMSQLRLDEPAIQLASLRACLSDETLRVVRNFPLVAVRNNIDVILTHLETYAVGQVNEVLQRMQFNNRIQSEHETYDDLLTARRDLSRLCNFCIKCNDSLIRDRIVIGLRCRETAHKLCAVSGLTLSRSLEPSLSAGRRRRRPGMCRRSTETGPVPVVSATADGTTGAGGVTLQLMTNRTISRGAVTFVGRSEHAVAAAPSRVAPDVRRRDQTPRGATAAGRPQHRHPADCPVRRQERYRCLKLGHFASICRSPPARHDSRDGDAHSSAIIAATGAQSAPLVRLRARAHPHGAWVTVGALPDTGADVTVTGVDFMRQLGEPSATSHSGTELGASSGRRWEGHPLVRDSAGRPSVRR